MSNVVQLRRHGFGRVDPAVPALTGMFAARRRQQHDPFWLKENAELLQVLAASSVRDADLSPYEDFAINLTGELQFFPQYYRLYLSMAVDLRALGMRDAPVSEAADFIQSQRLPEIELSDTHRGEADLLLRRAGVDLPADTARSDRLAQFAENAVAFCLPNRRAAYDLTHIVFHESDYGRRPTRPNAARRLSLIHAGLIAWLEDNMDLMAEIVIALRLQGEAVPKLWSDAVLHDAAEVEFHPGRDGARFDDDYHRYFVTNWASAVLGQPFFTASVPTEARLIHQRLPRGAALRELSMALLKMGSGRTSDWQRMRWRVWGKLSEPARQRIAAVETMPEFEGFFEGFARAGKGSGN